jgi:hypothetical protein
LATTSRSSCTRARCALLAALAALPLLASRAEAASTIVLGRVTDQASGSPVVGVEVRVTRDGAVLGTARTADEGRYQIAFDAGPPAPQNLTLIFDHGDYAGRSRLFGVAAGRPDQPAYDVELLPRSLAPCVQGEAHAVLVGRFTGEAGVDARDLSARVGQALTYSLLTELQRLRIRRELQPRFPACWEAELRAPDLAGRCARALQADALVFGRVVKAAGRFDVTTFIGDSSDVFQLPPAYVNRQVDLEAPEAATVDRRTHAAILTALAAGYARRAQHAECVEATVAAERLEGSASGALLDLRARCQGALPTNALRRGGNP